MIVLVVSPSEIRSRPYECGTSSHALSTNLPFTRYPLYSLNVIYQYLCTALLGEELHSRLLLSVRGKR